MSVPIALLGGAVVGAAAGSLLLPLTRRELAVSAARSLPDDRQSFAIGSSLPDVKRGHRVALAGLSGLLTAWVLHRSGGSPVALPPLILLVGLLQLAYCDLTRQLLPRTLVHALSAIVVASGVAVAICTGESQRLLLASLGCLACFALFLTLHLANPRWMAFGDVRLSLVFGFGLAWVNPMALVQGFLYANLLAALVGLALIALHRANRRSNLPFGLFMALGAGLVLLAWC